MIFILQLVRFIRLQDHSHRILGKFDSFLKDAGSYLVAIEFMLISVDCIGKYLLYLR